MLLDYKMPEMTGAEVAEVIRSVEPKYSNCDGIGISQFAEYRDPNC